MVRRLRSLLAIVALAGASALSYPSPSLGSAAAAGAGAVSLPPPAPESAAPAPKPNIVLILTDDLSTNLLPYMDEVNQMAADGVSFSQFITSNSLCCPSRATLFTGRYPHNHGVESNRWPVGGFGQFINHGHLDSSLSTYLSAAGYRTGLFGKYLNEYEIEGDTDGTGAPDYPPQLVPPGWDEWLVSDNGYAHFGYAMLQRLGGATTVEAHGTRPSDYLTDVMAAEATQFIKRNRSRSFFLMLSTFAPHIGSETLRPNRADDYSFPPAPRDRAASPNRPPGWGAPEFPGGDCGSPVDGGCGDLVFPQPEWEDFNVSSTAAPRWAPSVPLTAKEVGTVRGLFLERVQMVQAVDDLVGLVRDELAAQSLDRKTYVFFASDNGLHLGEHALSYGKETAYDHDVRVPFIVVPPEGARGETRDAVVSNVDILPTFLELAGAPTPTTVDGESALPLIDSDSPARRAVLIEHEAAPTTTTGRMRFSQDPDVSSVRDPEPPPYRAVRTGEYLYVDYSPLDDQPPGARSGEFYWLAGDPYQVSNLWPTLSAAQQAELNSYASSLASCNGAACTSIGSQPPLIELSPR